MEQAAEITRMSNRGSTRWRKFNLWILLGITSLALPIYALLALAMLFCDAPGAWCQDSANINLIYDFGILGPFAIWLILLIGAIRKRPWVVAVWAGGALLLVMVCAIAWLLVLAALF